jgi:Uma2 family endonuclease
LLFVLRTKMQEWIDKGAELGWLIDPGGVSKSV